MQTKRQRKVKRVRTPIVGLSRTKQSFRDECDIRNIMKKYKKTGVITHVRNKQALYGDFAQIGDYQDNLNAVILAQDMFMQLPAVVRERFGNDPGAFVAYATDPKNFDQMVKWGLAEKREDPQSDASKQAGEAKPAPPMEGGAGKPSEGSQGSR